MPSQDTIEILVADDTLLSQLGMKSHQFEVSLSRILLPIRDDLKSPTAQVKVTFTGEISELKKILAEKRWDFIALDNKWEGQQGAGEVGFKFATQLRQAEGMNQDAPFCIFTDQDWLRNTANVDRIFELDKSIGDIGSFADFFPKPQWIPTSDSSAWLQLFGVELLIRMKACFRLRALVRKLDDALASEIPLIGSTQAIKTAINMCRRVGPTVVPVLVTGESGTGKELVADLIHRFSPRAEGPLIKINCGALPRELIETELFGSVKGAFTGAIKRPGLFRQAENGTLFLDEITELPMETQSKLLRVLQDLKVRPVGEATEIGVNCRILAATNRNPQRAVEEGRLREDLYYRLNVVCIHLPPLCDRREDISLLADFFVNKHRISLNSVAVRLSSMASDTLLKHDWPGNVRELKNVIQSALVFAESAELSAEDIKAAIRNVNGSERPLPASRYKRGENEPLRTLMERVERDAIEEALEASHWSQKTAATALGISESTLSERKQKFGIQQKGSTV